MIDNLMRRFNDWLTRHLYRQHLKQIRQRKQWNFEGNDD